MRYLFFDIECANCYGGKCKIYSFGYLITDEQFNILTPPEDLLINPDCKFDPYVKKNILLYDRKLITSMPKFDQRYKEIKALMTAKEVVCIGYGVENDVRFLADDCKRYNLPLIKAKVYDVQKLIKIACDRPARKLQIEFTEAFGECEEKPHRSDTDAVRTMMLCKKICGETGESVKEIYKREK